MNDNEENGDSELDYRSSVDPFQPEKEDPSIDAPDEKALGSIMSVLEGEIKRYHTISGMKRFDKKRFTADQREEMCDQYTQLLGNLVILINNALDGIKEKQP